jgi:DNA-binding LacI/PurR family transcriptional regulator
VSSPQRGAGPTLEQVAALARVSRSTVSRVVNGHPRVSPEARAAVEAAIARLGYVPNPAARSLATRRSGTVAMVIRESGEQVLEEPFFGAVLRAVGTALRRSGLQLLLLVEAGDAPEQLEHALVHGGAEGVVLLSLHDDDPLPRALADRGLPVVISGRPPDDVPVSSVDADNVGAGRLAMAHLLATGRRRIAVVAGPSDMAVAADRLAGTRLARQEAGLALDPALEAVGDFTPVGGERAAAQLLAAIPDLDAVVAPSDLAAIGVLRALRAAGRQVPDDVAVTGCDDSIVAEAATPSLTSIRQPLAALGRAMVRLLLDRIAEGPDLPPERVVLPTELIRRASS